MKGRLLVAAFAVLLCGLATNVASADDIAVCCIESEYTQKWCFLGPFITGTDNNGPITGIFAYGKIITFSTVGGVTRIYIYCLNPQTYVCYVVDPAQGLVPRDRGQWVICN